MSEDVADHVPKDDVTAAWWEATRQRRLVLQRCRGCRHWQHYPRAICLRCGSAELDFEDVLGRGIVDTHTTVHRQVRAELPPPYVVARVRLDEGPILLTNLIDPNEASPSVLHDDLIDRRVVVDWTALPDGRHLPVFRLDTRR